MLAFEADGTLLVASGSVAGVNGAILDYDSGGNFLVPWCRMAAAAWSPR